MHVVDRAEPTQRQIDFSELKNLGLWYRVFKLVILVASLVFMVKTVNAQEAGDQLDSPPFETTVKTTYQVHEDGNTHVTQEFSVTNTSPTYYLSEYSLQINFPNLQNLVIKNNNNQIDVQVSEDANSTQVKIPFPDQIVGEGKVRNFSVEYDTTDVATVANRVLEVQIPPLSSQQGLAAQEVILKTPLKFGRAIRVSPDIAASGIDNDGIVTKFDQHDPQPISAFYGEEQIFNIILRYNLENNSSSRGLAQIALPPDTPYQRMFYHSLDPFTDNLKVDEDGNWLATYELNPNTAESVYLTADVRLTLEPNGIVSQTKPTNFHTASDKYWEVSQKNLKNIETDIDTPSQIYHYVVNTLNYDYDGISDGVVQDRMGANQALDNPDEAVCQEFTDAFIALAREKNIPARRLLGYAYTQNPTLRPLSLETDVLHAWPEYFDVDSGTWKPVDPTWEDTTGGIDYFDHFDLNHIVFAINGESSSTPYPAGAYKGENIDSKDVEVSFAQNFPATEPSYELAFIPEKIFGVSVPGRYTLTIKNTSGQAWYDIAVNFKSDVPLVALKNSSKRGSIELPIILPYQTVSTPVLLTTQNIQPQSTNITYQITTDEKVTSQTTPAEFVLQTGPHLIAKLNEELILLGVGVTALVGLLVAGGVLVLRQRR